MTNEIGTTRVGRYRCEDGKHHYLQEYEFYEWNTALVPIPETDRTLKMHWRQRRDSEEEMSHMGLLYLKEAREIIMTSFPPGGVIAPELPIYVCEQEPWPMAYYRLSKRVTRKAVEKALERIPNVFILDALANRFVETNEYVRIVSPDVNQLFHARMAI